MHASNYPATLANVFLSGDAGNKKHDLTTQNSMIHVIKNLSSTHNNLKSNVFDKMLSDEMLSIKQRFFQKDLAYTSNVHKVTKSNAATPTLEVKQKWHVVDLTTKPLNTDNLETDDASRTDSYEIKHKSNLNLNEPKIKSLDVRSLSGHSGNFLRSPEIKCNCANANANHQCKHGDDCTRKAPYGLAIGNSPYPGFYMPYQPYFVSDNNENQFQNTFYHPQIINELKIPKTTKNRKPNTFRDGDLYYDDDWKKRRVPKDDDEIIMNIDYDVEDNKKPGFSLNCIHEDLKEVYNKGVKRKCYCSLSQRAKSHKIVIFMCVFASLSGSFGLNFLL